jgi:hypothetical protein
LDRNVRTLAFAARVLLIFVDGSYALTFSTAQSEFALGVVIRPNVDQMLIYADLQQPRYPVRSLASLNYIADFNTFELHLSSGSRQDLVRQASAIGALEELIALVSRASKPSLRRHDI